MGSHILRIDKKYCISYTVCDKTEVVFIRNMKKYLLAVMMFLLLACSTGTMMITSAKTVNAVTEAHKVTGGKWINSAKGKKYLYADGSTAKSVWLNLKGTIYRIKKNGVRATGWFKVGGKQFYASKTGKVYIKRWLNSGNSRYYFQRSGICAAKKWLKINGTEYYFLKSGKLAVNRIVRTGDISYYVDQDGKKVKSSWAQWKGKYYYLDRNGYALKNSWLRADGKFYYFGADGVMLTSQWIDAAYYVDETGARVTDGYVDGFYLGSDGRKIGYAEHYIFVGDSRMVGMQSAVADSDVRYIAKVGEGYDWMEAEAGPRLREYLDLRSEVTVVLALGVNDMGNISNYISYYQKLVLEYPQTRFYILSVNPLDEKAAAKYGYKVKESDIIAFNQKLQSVFSATQYVDSYSYLKNLKSFATVDGLHYTKETYQSLYQFLMPKIR